MSYMSKVVCESVQTTYQVLYCLLFVDIDLLKGTLHLNLNY